MPRELLMMQNSFQWGTAEGQTLEIENAIRSNVRDLKIEGQTYQNLLSDTKTLGNYTYDESTGEYTLTNPATKVWNAMYISYTRPIQKGEKLLIRVNIVKNTIATTDDSPLKITFSNFSSSTNGFINVDSNFTGLLEHYCDGAAVKEPDNKNIGITTRNYTSGELVIKDIQVIPVLSNPIGSTELPTSINGIESVAERETNVLQIAQSSYETDEIVLPNGVKNSIEMVNGVLTHIQRVEKYTANDTRFITGEELIHKTSVMFKIYPKEAYSWLKPKKYNDTKSHPICSLFNYIPSEKDAGELYASESDDACFYTGGADWLRVKLTKATYGKIISLTEFLEMKPIIYYELLTPVYTPIEEVTNIDLPQSLRSLPNGVRDTVEGNKVIKRIGKYTLTGNEKFEIRNENDSVFKIQCGGLSIEQPSGYYVNSDVNMICDKAKCEFCGDLLYVNNSLIICGRSYEFKGFIISIPKSLLTEYTVDNALEYIKSLGGITVYYELATPIEHTISVPPITISKGTNMVATNNNIKPELTCKYKQSKKIIKYLYNSGNEYLNITGGWNTQLTAGYGEATTIVKNANNIYLPSGVWNMLLTNNKIDVTNYDMVYMKYSKEYSSFQSHPARCAIKLGNKNTSWTDFADDKTTGALIGKDETENNVTNGILTIDVSNVTGSYYVGIGGQSNNITVHEIGLKKYNGDTTTLYSNGNENEVLTGGYLTSSNNSATCNIEKQADNLYVNCTGKTSFDSICYTRTNKTIKPCKIKVSVKNNYISANGIAFCVFLSEKEAITSVSDFNSVVNKKYIKASNTTPNEYIDLEMDLTDSTEGYFYIACMVAGNTGYTCTANIRKIEIIR